MPKDFQFHKAKRAFHDLSKEETFIVSKPRPLHPFYGCSVWQPSITYMRKLEKFQSSVFRSIIPDLEYVSKLQRFSFLPVCYQKIESDMVLLWKMINKQAEVEREIQSSFFNTRSSTLGLFSVPKMQKFCSEDNCFVRATRCANELLKLNVIKFDMPLGIFRTKGHIFLVEKLTYLALGSFPFVPPQYECAPQLQTTCHYIVNYYVEILHVRLGVANNMRPLSWGGTNGKDPNIDISCSYFVKCFCKNFRS